MDAADDLTVLEPDESLFVESPLLNDPYVWDQCAITVEYILLPNKIVQVGVRNHEDRPIEKVFAAAEVPLSGLIGNMLAEIYKKKQPNANLYVVIVLLPKLPDQDKRLVTVSVWAGFDAPNVECITEANLSLPGPINAMLDELKILLPARGGNQIDGSCASDTQMIIRPPSRWEQSIATPKKPREASKAIQWIADFIKGLGTLVCL